MSGLTILHLLPALDYGGVARYVIGLSAALRARGHRCIIASDGGDLLAEVEAAGVHHIPVKLRGCRGPAAVLHLARMIDRNQVDLVNAHNWTAGAVGFLAARLAQIPYVFTVHGVRHPLQRFFVYYWGEKVITVSRASRDHLVAVFGLPPTRVVASPIGVDTDRFKPRPCAASVLRELRLDASAPKIVHVSRFSRSKAEVALRLTEAALDLERRVPGFQAIVAGEGPLQGEVAAGAENANRRLGRRAFVFAGARSDVADLMSVAEVVVGTATVALEAMACGKPVVAAGKRGFAGLVTADNFEAACDGWFGDHGAAESITPAALAEAIGAALEDEDKAAELGRFGRRTAVRSFSLPRVAAHVEGIYRGLLMGTRPVQRIAVFHLNQIGDLLFSLPALAALRARFPEAEIVSILRPHLAELMQGSPYVDRLLLRRGGAVGEARLARELRRCRFDLVVAFSQSASSMLQALACWSPRRIGFVDADLSFLLTCKIHVRGVPWPGKLGRLAVCLGADAPRVSYVGMIDVSTALRERSRRLLQQHGVSSGRRLAVLAPGASGRKRYKAWQAHKFAAVGDYLHQRWGAQVVIVGSKDDRLEAERVTSSMSAPAVNLAGGTTTGELAALVEHADLLVGIDSGPLHLAAAMGTPTVALFGPTDPSKTGPQGDGHQVVTAGLPCSPCIHGCATRACMDGIGVQQVIDAVERILQARR